VSNATDEYRRNHYVPQWYQKRFIPSAQVDQELYYLDLRPDRFTDPRGVTHLKRNPRRQGFRRCFVERDLYTAMIGGIESTDVETLFFGDVDRDGRNAVEYFANFEHPWDGTNLFHALTAYMTVQKLRTPKGLAWLEASSGTNDKNAVLRAMIGLQQLYCTIWAECVWLIADASESATKFIISDHPVTVYNRRCGPRSAWCRGDNDPDIRYHGTHTIFPLSMDKVLLLTNLSWVRNPYQRETDYRPHPNFYHETLLNILDVQTLRHLSEDEVREINFIIKQRARRYVAAGREEWLYPEKYVSKSEWARFGQGYLLMPDPRAVMYGTQTIVGFKDGTSKSLDAYGRQPGQEGYDGDRKTVGSDWTAFHRFQGEFASLFGPRRRGRAFHMTHLDNEYDTEDYHKYHLSLLKKGK
jgi:hypothetical protein